MSARARITAKKVVSRIAAIAVLATVASSLHVGASGAVTGVGLVPVSGRLVGVDVDNGPLVDKESFKNGVDRRELDAGRKLDVLPANPYTFPTAFPSWRESWMASTGHIPLVSWLPGYSPAIANGSKDAVLDAHAASVKAFAKPMFLSYTPSMDKADVTQVVSPASFVAAWRRAHDRFVAAGASNAVWVWCPSTAAWAAGTAMSWYPGDGYVDWTCAQGTNTAAAWTPFATMFQPFTTKAPAGKPQMAVFGTSEGALPGQKATWIDWAFKNTVSSFPNLKALIYDDKTAATTLSTSAAAAAAFSTAATYTGIYTPPAPVALPAGKLVPTSGAYVGTYQPADTQTAEMAAITSLETTMGRKEDIAHSFYGWTDTFPTWRETWNLNQGRIPLISWAPTRTTDITAGTYDTMIRTRAQALKALPGQVFLRWFWEMDGATNATTAVSAPAYIAAYQHIHDLFAAEGATNVAFVWSPNAWGIEQGTAQAFYPGDNNVDWIAADGYNWAPLRTGARWLSFTNTFSAFYTWAETKNKPIMIAETGVLERNPGEKAQWIKDMGTSLKVNFPKIRALTYFNHTTTSYSDGNTLFPWNLNTTPTATTAWTTTTNLPQLIATR